MKVGRTTGSERVGEVMKGGVEGWRDDGDVLISEAVFMILYSCPRSSFTLSTRR